MPTTTIHTLSLHDALPISQTPPNRNDLVHRSSRVFDVYDGRIFLTACLHRHPIIAWLNSSSLDDSVPGVQDRKSTRLNSSHPSISYAVFCLKKKNVSFTLY